MFWNEIMHSSVPIEKKKKKKEKTRNIQFFNPDIIESSISAYLSRSSLLFAGRQFLFFAVMMSAITPAGRFSRKRLPHRCKHSTRWGKNSEEDGLVGERERAIEIFRAIDRGFEFITDTGSKITAARVIKNILRAPRIAKLWRAV